MANVSPAFQFYPRDFVFDVQFMTAEAIGAYTLILCAAWNAPQPGYLENDPEILAPIGKLDTKGWERCSKAIMRALKTTPDGKHVFSKRLVEVYNEQAAQRQQASDAGKASAEARAQRKSNAKPTIVQRPLNYIGNESTTAPSTESNSASASASASATAELKNEREPGARARVIGARLTTQWGQRWQTRVLMPEQYSISCVAALMDEYMRRSGEDFSDDLLVDAFIDRCMKAFLKLLASWSFDGAATPQMFVKKWADIQTVLGGRDPAARRAQPTDRPKRTFDDGIGPQPKTREE